MTLKKLFPISLALASITLASLSFASGYAIRTVRAGDSIGSIANLYDISVDTLMSFNELESVVIHPGDVLKIPYAEATGGAAETAPKPPAGFRTHTLKQGEALSTVASMYGLTLKALIGANPDMSSMDRLPAGIELLIPPSEGLVITLDEGEDISALLQAHQVDPVEFMKVNAISSPADIHPGVMLFLPGVEPTQALERLARVREEENRYIWPIHGRITSYFGRRNLGMGTSSFHRAIDIAAPTGTPVAASRSGVVTFAGWSTSGYGNLVKIRHAGNTETWYAHNSRIDVQVGQYVNQGDVISRVGSTGLSTGPHLHFELHEQGTAVDPLSLLN